MPMAFRFVAVALLLAPLAAGGCAGPAHMAGTGPIAVAPRAGDAMAVRFPGAEAILQGVRIARAGEGWRPGDRVLLGLTFERGETTIERMLLVELEEEPGRRPRFRRRVGVFGDEVRIESPTRATRLLVFDAAGALLADDRGQLAELFLEYGPWEVARIGGGYAIATGAADEPPANPRPEITLEALRPGVYGMMSLLAFGEGASDNETLATLIEKAFTMRQKLGLLFSMGRFEIRMGNSTPVPPDEPVRRGLAGLEAYDCEVRISIGDTLALSGRAVLAPSVAPLGLCGGIVWADLRNAADADIRVGVTLLGADLGPEPAPERGSGAADAANPGG